MKKTLFAIFSLAFILFLHSCKKESPADPTTPPDPTDPPKEELTYPKKEMRGVWIATVWGLDWPQAKYDVTSQKKFYTDYLDRFKEMNINAVFVQIKGMGDAYYNSPYEPWSVSITGTRGTDPGYDVLKFMVDEAHARGIEFHAWMNPYRIATRANAGASYPSLHPSVQPDWVVSHEKIQIYNPAVPEVRQRLADIVKDVINKYNVDGIHFDDYFYPDPSSAGVMVSDDPDYQKYGAGYATKADFRRANVDKAIQAVHDVIVATRPNVVFSVSPAPNHDYNYNTLYADVRKWCQEGWLDIVIPQLYQEIGNQYNDFQVRLSWWAQYNYDAVLMVGHALYKFGDPSMPSAFQSPDELQRQFDMTRRNKKAVGNLMYSAQYILQNRVGITNKLTELYKDPAVIPFAGRAVAAPPAEPTNVKVEGSKLIWGTSGQVRSVVYYFSDLKKEGVVLGITDKKEWPVTKNGFYSVSTLNADNKESKPSKPIEKK